MVRRLLGEALLARQCRVGRAPLQGSGGRILSAAPQYLLGTSCVPGHMLQTFGAAALDPPAPSYATTTLEVKIWGPRSDLVSMRPQCNEVPG